MMKLFRSVFLLPALLMLLPGRISAQEYSVTQNTHKKIDNTYIRLAMEDVAYMDIVRLAGPAKAQQRRRPDCLFKDTLRDNPLVFYSYVFFPNDIRQNRKYPLLVFPHGGIHGSFGTSYIHVLREMVAQGYIVICPDYRGSVGYGRSFYQAIDYGGLENEDVLAARDYMVENYDVVDSTRVGIIGWSHGGMITLMNILRYPEKYVCGYAGVPVSDVAYRLTYQDPSYKDDFAVSYHIGALPEEKPEEKPAPAEKKEETVASREIKREDYVPSSVISPMFGVQNNKTGKKGKKKPEVIPDLADINSDNKSVLGTVFSPMYGDKDAENPVPDDTVDPKVAKLSVQDIISDKKGETKPAVKPAVKPVKKETEKKAEEKKADNPAIRPTLSVFGNPIETKKPEVKAKTKPFIDVGKKKSESRMPDLSVTPFGTGGSARETEDQASAPVSIHDAWKETRGTSERKTEEIKKVLEEVERNISDEHNYENLSLFDVEDD